MPDVENTPGIFALFVRCVDFCKLLLHPGAELRYTNAV